MTLTEVLIATALGAILVGGMMSAIARPSNNVQTAKAYMYRDQIVKLIQTYASSPQALKKSFESALNPALQACVTPPSTGPNPGCVHGQEYPLVLFDSQGGQVTGKSSAPIANPNAADTPTYYSILDGSLCLDATNAPIIAPALNCSIEAVTSFIPTCMDPGNACLVPTKIGITIHYRVRQVDNPLQAFPVSFKPVISPPAPPSYQNALSVSNGYFTN